MADNNPVGVFDSGLGGISVLRIAAALLKNENFIYFGDNAYAPYGSKSAQEITDRTLYCAEFLRSKKCKVIVVACNTATSAAINKTRGALNIPVVSIEPAIKPALESSTGGKIIMLATPATCSLQRYLELKERLDVKRQVIDVGGYGIVERLESGVFGDGSYFDLLDSVLAKYEGETIDGIVLGCTHYPFIKDQIRAYALEHFKGKCELFDGGMGTALQLRRVLETNGLESSRQGGNIEFFTSGEYDRIIPIFNKLLNTGY